MSFGKIVGGRCPRCGEGSVFKDGPAGVLGLMRDECEVCGLSFMREEGYFLGAMYISYGLGVFTVLPLAMGLALIGWPLWLVLFIAVVQTLVSVPIFLRLSRVIWLYGDQAIDPR